MGNVAGIVVADHELTGAARQVENQITFLMKVAVRFVETLDYIAGDAMEARYTEAAITRMGAPIAAVGMHMSEMQGEISELMSTFVSEVDSKDKWIY